LIGKRYKEEKKAVGENQYTDKNRIMQNAQSKPTVQKIAEQTKVNPSTVQRAENIGINYIGYYQVKERRNNSESQTCI
jgi:hypothetical protein